MRLSSSKQTIMLGNNELLSYCDRNRISIEELGKCSIERMGNDYLFTLQKDTIPESQSLIPLDVDIATQPDVVLVVSVVPDTNRLEFKVTDFTKRLIDV